MVQLALVTILLMSLGCEDSSASNSPVPFPIQLLVRDDQGCAVEVSTDQLDSLLAEREPEDALTVVEVARIEECSGAGGTHFFARATTGSRGFWMGAHECSLEPFVPGPPEIVPGVVIARQTAGLFTASDGWCLNYPGESDPFTTDQSTSAVLLFESRADANAFEVRHQ